jgi:tripartite-type tricarboxylate transporter receptor subunit TctC
MQFASAKRTMHALAAALLVTACWTASAAEKYPSRPVEFIVPWGPGGGADQVARKAGKMMEDMLHTSFPVVNVPGATGQTGLTKMLTAPADGYTISIMTGDTFSLLASSHPKWKLSDFIPVAIMIKQPSGFFAASNGPLKTWNDVVSEAKKRPLKVAITGFGSPDDIHVNYFKSKGINLAAVPFAKPGERYTSILGGHADLLYEQLGDVKSFLDNKQMHPVIVFDEQRYPVFKDVPTSYELKFPISIYQFRMVIMKKGTDPQRVKVISDALAKVAADADYKAYLKDQYASADSYIPSSGAQKFLESELAKMKKFAQAAGMK